MCLKYIGERVSANEGVGYKELTLRDYKLTTAVIGYPVITDTWLLHKEPKKCTYTMCGLIAGKHYSQYFNFGPSPKMRLITTAYDHGFHLWKIKPTILSCMGRTYKVCYKGIIAEDDTQIVAKQIYICDKTTHPDQSLVKQEVPNYENAIKK